MKRADLKREIDAALEREARLMEDSFADEEYAREKTRHDQRCTGHD